MRARRKPTAWWWAQAAGTPVDPGSLAVVRIVLGAVGVLSAVRIAAYGWIDSLYAGPTHRFTYLGFGWVPQPSRPAMVALVAGLGAASLALAVGWRTRWAALGVVVALGWIELIDVTTYLNHYWFLTLVALLGVVAPLGAGMGLDARRAGGPRTVARGWVWLLRFQVGLVYASAGVAKLQADWLVHARPLRLWLPAHEGAPVVGPLLAAPATAHVLSWAGAAFDVSVVPLLLWRRTRPFAWAALVAFHVSTWALFPIGVFPWLMIGASTVFFEPDWARRALARVRRTPVRVPVPTRTGAPTRTRDAGITDPWPRRRRFVWGWLGPTGVPTPTRDTGITDSWPGRRRFAWGRLGPTGVATGTGDAGITDPSPRRRGFAGGRLGPTGVATGAGDAGVTDSWPRRRGFAGGRSSGRRPWPARALAQSSGGAGSAGPWRRRGWTVLAGLWVAVQLALPARHLLYPGDHRWTGQGYRFAWNVLLTEKSGAVSFLVSEPATGRRWVADPTELYTPTQVRAMSSEPDLIHQAARTIAAEERDRGHEVEVRVDAWVSLDGRPARRLVDPTVDLAHVPRDPWSDDWILPGE